MADCIFSMGCNLLFLYKYLHVFKIKVAFLFLVCIVFITLNSVGWVSLSDC